jgi:hypothetical protein
MLEKTSGNGGTKSWQNPEINNGVKAKPSSPIPYYSGNHV